MTTAPKKFSVASARRFGGGVANPDISHPDVNAPHTVEHSFNACHCENRSDEAIHLASPRPRSSGSR